MKFSIQITLFTVSQFVEESLKLGNERRGGESLEKKFYARQLSIDFQESILYNKFCPQKCVLVLNSLTLHQFNLKYCIVMVLIEVAHRCRI